MSKRPISLRLDDDLLERAKVLCERDKTTLTQMLTDVLLAHVEKREHEIAHLAHSPSARANRDKVRPRAPIDWRKKRRVKERFNFTCQRCGLTEEALRRKEPYRERADPWANLHVAHIVPQVQFENPKAANVDDNLTLLCPQCHTQDHRNQRDYIDYNNRIK